MQPIIEKLLTLINDHGWAPYFQQAIDNAAACNVASIQGTRTTDDYLRRHDLFPARQVAVQRKFNLQIQARSSYMKPRHRPMRASA